MKITILSAASNCYSTRRLVEAAKTKHDVRVIDHTKCFCTISRNKPAVFFDGKELPNFNAIIPRIGASVTFYGAAVVRQFETIGTFTTTGSIALSRSRDKLRSLQALIKQRISIPNTAFARYHKQVDSILEAVGGPPVVIKLLEGTQGRGVVLADSIVSARSTIQAFNGLKANIIVQEFVKEAQGSDIRVFVIGGKVVAAIRRQGNPGEFRSNLHQGGKATAVKLDKTGMKLAIRACAALNLSVAGVDMLESKDGYKVIEVNASPGLEGIETATGIDVAARIIEYAQAHATKRHKKRDRIGV